MEFKLQPEWSASKDELQRGMVLMARSSLLPQINQSHQKVKQLFPNGYANQKFFNRYAQSEYLLAGCVTINLLLILVYFEMSLQNKEIKNWLLYMTTVLQFFCIFSLILNYIIYNEYKMQENHHHELKKSRELIFYSVILLIKPYPFLEEYEFTIRNQLIDKKNPYECHKVNDILCIFSLLEVLLIIPSMFVCSKFHSLRSQRISEMYGFRSSYFYALRCWFKENSVLAVSVSFILWFMVCVLAIRMAEYHSNNMLESFENSVWLTYITMTTVGLGDLMPKTYIGYVVNSVTMYSGVIISSIAVMILRNTFSLTPRNFLVNAGEKRTLSILNSLQEKQELRLVACEFIRQTLCRMWQNKKRRRAGQELQSASLNERNVRQKFKIIRRQAQKMNYQNNIKDEFNNNFAKIYGYINNLNDNHDAIIQYLHSRKY